VKPDGIILSEGGMRDLPRTHCKHMCKCHNETSYTLIKCFRKIKELVRMRLSIVIIGGTCVHMIITQEFTIGTSGVNLFIGPHSGTPDTVQNHHKHGG
jgi:hypothetical protein